MKSLAGLTSAGLRAPAHLLGTDREYVETHVAERIGIAARAADRIDAPKAKR